MQNPDNDFDTVPLDGQLRYCDSILQRWEWSNALSRFDWFDVPEATESKGETGND